ncbi:MAG: hypothetical protein ACR2PU_03875, partial [Gammaproteobacteria bacterium]
MIFVGIFQSSVYADWINLSGAENARNIAEITVLNNRVEIALEIILEDLDQFEPAEGSAENFAFQVLVDDDALKPEIVLREQRMRKDRLSPYAGMIDPRTRRRVPGPPEDKRVIYIELHYAFDTKPDILNFVPPLDKTGLATVTIGFIAYHKATPINDFRYLSNAAKLLLDWKDPWFSKFENPNIKRHHQSPLMSFLYVEPREIRHEGIMRVRDLQSWTELNLKDNEILDIEDQKHIKEVASTFFMQRNPLKIDGVLSNANNYRAEFLRITSVGLRVIDEDKPLDRSTAIIGVSESHWIKYLPQNVTVNWNLFSDRVDRLPSTVTDPAGPLQGFIFAEDPIIEWQNFLRTYQEPQVRPVTSSDGRFFRVPIASVLLFILAIVLLGLGLHHKNLSTRILVGFSVISVVAALLLLRVAIFTIPNPFPGMPTPSAAKNIVAGLLFNTSHAFLEKNPDTFKQALSNTVDDNNLDEIADELGRAFAVQISGGGVASVQGFVDLELDEISPLDNTDGFRTLGTWTANVNAR